MSVEFDPIHPGDTGPILTIRPEPLDPAVLLSPDWHCYIAANTLHGGSAVPAREVTDKTEDGLRWIAALTPAETATLPVGKNKRYTTYVMVVEVINESLTPKFSLEKHYQFDVAAQGIQ